MGRLAARVAYYQRLAGSYLRRGPSQLSFWWERPEVHPDAPVDRLGPYHMPFRDKAAYAGPFDAGGVPLLDYHGRIGPQHNPIAIAQYGLAKHNAWLERGQEEDRSAFLVQASWLRDNLRPNARGVRVWMHDFDWEYANGLRAPWYSGLAQGQGISCLLRAHDVDPDAGYLDAARDAAESLRREVADGGVLSEGPGSGVWIEEYLTDPPSHILNGYLWAIWGVHDYAVATGEAWARDLFARGAKAIEADLPRFDTGWWSRYDLWPARLPCLASPFYHRLHVVQLRVTFRLTGSPVFRETADRWEAYAARPLNRRRALAHKALFKLAYY